MMMMGGSPKRFFASIAWLALACIAIAASGCSPPSGGLGQPVPDVEHAQTQVRFPLRLPVCLPRSVNPVPVRVGVDNRADSGYQAVDVEYGYRVRPNSVPGNLAYAVSIIEQQNAGGERFLLMSGRHVVLDGIEAVETPPQTTPGVEWIQNETRFDLYTTLSWDDTLRAYHSIVMGSSNCDPPRMSGLNSPQP